MAFYRRVVIKASIRSMAGRGYAALKLHVDYICRDGTDERGNRAELYGSDETTDIASELCDHETDRTKDFVARCKDDRHHFRFVLAPEDSPHMQDLTGFTKDFVMQMEKDLGTKLDWVAANHYDTGQPHTHLVIRGVREGGKDLVIPRKYISQTLRQRAQDLVEMELGPVTQIEGRVRLAHQVGSERFTGIDKTLAESLDGDRIDMSKSVPNGRVWLKHLQVRRLNKLKRMGLAEDLGSGRWQLKPDFNQTLRNMGERGDIIKAIHRSLKDDEQSRVLITERNCFDPNDPNGTPITGIVKNFGQPDDTRESGFVVVSSLQGQPIYAKVAVDETFESLKAGQIVTFQPHQRGPRKIDQSIAEFAEKHGGIYSEALHVTEGGNVSQEYARAHVRRLEALRRKNLVTLNRGKTWKIPRDYLTRAESYEAERAQLMPAAMSRRSTLTLDQLENARGVTWLDHELSGENVRELRNRSVQASLLKRRAFLKKLGFEFSKDGQLPSQALDSLREMDLRDAAGEITKATQKPYSKLGQSREVEGVYREALERPSGVYAVIERARDFTLVPWRPIMERRLGRSISGRVSAVGISWDVTNQRGLSR